MATNETIVSPKFSLNSWDYYRVLRVFLVVLAAWTTLLLWQLSETWTIDWSVFYTAFASAMLEMVRRYFTEVKS